MIPDVLTGGWVRNGIGIDGAPPREDELVWWLQAPSTHCDLRLSGDGASCVSCFAGITTWADPVLTWTHELDLEPSSGADIGVITWDGEVAIEAGTFIADGRPVRYTERWQRLPDSDGELLALSSPGGRLVRTGRYALTVLDERLTGGPFAAVAWVLREGGWAVDHRWPAGAVAPAPPAVLDDADATVRLEDGTEWTITEHRKAAEICG